MRHNTTAALNCALTRTAIRELTGTGTLRIALNLSNDLLVRKTNVFGSFSGLGVEIARHLATLLQVPPEFVVYESAGAACAACERDEWDIALLARDHARNQRITLTRPYLLLPGAYAVPVFSPIYRTDQVDQRSTCIVVERNSVHDLYLSHSLEFASFRRGSTFADVLEIARSSGYLVAADRHRLERANAPTMQFRLLEEHTMLVEHALGIPRGRHAAAALIDAYVRNLVSTKFVEFLLDLHGVGCAVTVPDEQFTSNSVSSSNSSDSTDA
ncbi:type 2 periplasmic-binding domain-containing protein [Paraburkholderia tropica]|uniref:transporter substrate-binding domain-containing protein n=1 Tax=Paraburkholderia tropica TaxID=92647 RepID=UPI002AB2CD38|nr:transporter substrate-binding domain-containing protein [Paraburkholderia tropica]